MIGITLTGVDERTSLDDLIRLARTYPCVEIAALYTENPEGRNRYPGINYICDVINILGEQSAVHICGRDTVASVLDGCYPLLSGAGRIQVNPKITEDELKEFLAKPYEETERLHGFRTVITQWSVNNSSLVNTDIKGHCLLVDSSGGRGRSPEKWERPDTRKSVGFAGGLGLDNLHIELPKIMEIATGDWWIDMEAKLRVDDWFSVDIAERIIERFLSLIQGV